MRGPKVFHWIDASAPLNNDSVADKKKKSSVTEYYKIIVWLRIWINLKLQYAYMQYTINILDSSSCASIRYDCPSVPFT